MNKVSEFAKEESWDMVIKPRSGWFDIHLGELYHYRDLIYMFVRPVLHWEKSHLK
jgi:lipopolysaccharide transport system permease protein